MRGGGRWIVSALVWAALASGCAATGAVQNARQGLDQARTAEAETKAPYEYYAAEAFLGLAEHESEELDGRAAREFADQSAAFSTRAVTKSRGGAQ